MITVNIRTRKIRTDRSEAS